MIPDGLPRARVSFGRLVAQFLFGRAAVWIVAAVVSLVLTVAMSYLALAVSLLLGGALVALACAGIIVKDQVHVVGRGRIVRRAQRLSRRRVLAMGLAIACASGVLTALARTIGMSVVRQSEEEFKRRARPNRKKGEF